MLNKVILIGRVGKDPAVKFIPSGSACAQFSLATTETWKDKDGSKQERTDWHQIVAWGKLAEIIGEYITKGSLICIVGKVNYRSYETKEGEKKFLTEIVANEMKMLGGGKPKEPAQNAGGPPPNDNDIPF